MKSQLFGSLRGIGLVLLTPLLVAAECNDASITMTSTGSLTAPVGKQTSMTMTVINDGGVDVRLGTVSPAALGLSAPFSLTGGTCATSTLLTKNGGSCTLVLSYLSLQATAHNDVIELAYSWDGDDAGSRVFSQAISGSARRPLAVDLPSSVRDVPLLATRDISVNVRNDGGVQATLGDLSTGGLKLSAPFSRVGGSCQSSSVLAAGASCNIVVRYQPTTVGNSSARLEIQYNWPNSGVASAVESSLLSGHAVPPLRLTASPPFFATTPLGSSSTQTLTITNGGGQAATLGPISNASLGLAAPFALAGGSCQSGAALAPGGACTLEVRFTPSALGSFFDDVLITYAWPGAPAGFSLSRGLSAIAGTQTGDCYQNGCASGQVCVQVTSNPASAGTCVAVPNPPPGCMAPCIWEARKNCLPVRRACSVEETPHPPDPYAVTRTRCDTASRWAVSSYVYDGVTIRTDYRRNGSSCYSIELVVQGPELRHRSGAQPIGVSALVGGTENQRVWCGPYTSSAGLDPAQAYEQYPSEACTQWFNDYLSWTECRSAGPATPNACAGL